MSSSSIGLSENLLSYLHESGVKENKFQKMLRQETQKHPLAQMQISPEQGQFMALLSKIMNTKKYLEIGVFTGYSTMTMAFAMGNSGKTVALDISKEHTNTALKFWKKAGVDKKIQLIIGPALESLQKMINNHEHETFDFAFIDADKINYLNYYKLCLNLVRPGGIICIDNVLWGGSVIDPSDKRKDTVAIRNLNDYLIKDNRVFLSMIPIGDGLTIARKKE